MRRLFNGGRVYFFLIILALLSLIMIFSWEINKPQKIDNPASNVAVWLETYGFNDSAQGKGDTPNRAIVRSGLVPSLGHWLLLGRQILPAWSRVIFTKTVIAPSFFMSAMVILLFFAFYQSSRGGKEEAGEGMLEIKV